MHSVSVGLAVANEGRDRFKLAVRLQGGVRAIEGMALVEDEGHFPSGAFSWEVRTHGTPSDSTTNSLASNKPFQSPNCRSRAPNSEVPPPAARRSRAVDADADRAVGLVLPKLPGLRVPTVRLLAGHALDLAGGHRNSGAVDPQQNLLRRCLRLDILPLERPGSLGRSACRGAGGSPSSPPRRPDS